MKGNQLLELKNSNIYDDDETNVWEVDGQAKKICLPKAPKIWFNVIRLYLRETTVVHDIIRYSYGL